MKGRLDRYQEIILLEALEAGGALKVGQRVQLPQGACHPDERDQLSPAGIFFARAIKERDALQQQIDDYEHMINSLKFNIRMFDECRNNWSKAE